MTRFAAVLAVGLCSTVALAQAPDRISFDARLTDAAGQPLSGSHQLNFGLFGQSAGGTSVWSEAFATVAFSASGLAFIELGNNGTASLASVFDGTPLYLEVTVDGTALAPRMKVVSVPYALRAGTASAVGTLAAADVQRRVTGSCATGAISAVNVDGTVSCAALSVTAPLTASGGTIAMPSATGTTDGYLASADYAAFSAKRATGGNNLIDWTDVVAKWSNTCGTAPTVSLSTADAVDGDASFEFQVGTASTGGPCEAYGDLIPVDISKVYTGGIWVKLALGTGAFSAGVIAYDAAKTALGNRYFIANGATLTAGTWTELTGRINGTGAGANQFPANTRFIKPVIIVNASNVGTTRIDGFTVSVDPMLSRLSGAIELTTTTYTGTTFSSNATGGTKMCRTGYHICNAWEYATMSILAQSVVPQGNGWIAGGFSNLEAHTRSLVNGQDSVVCPAGLHLQSYARCCGNEPGWGGYFGRLHCVADATVSPVTCCRDNVLGGL